MNKIKKVNPDSTSRQLKEIGGYFGLELKPGHSYHPDALAFDSARSALRYFLRSKKIKYIDLPYYICNSVIDAVQKEGVNCNFYFIDDQLNPKLTDRNANDKAILVVNYFGILSLNEIQEFDRYKYVIIDNSQAFYNQIKSGWSAIYSPRKFFGVPDGGYLRSGIVSNDNLPQSKSYTRCGHLLRRIDLNADKGYSEFKKNEDRISGSQVYRMSSLTESILHSIEYEAIRSRRMQNFNRVHEALNHVNQLKINSAGFQAPMIYPLLINRQGLRNHLIQQKIYVAQYWKEVLKTVPQTTFEHHLAENLIALPIDQRWGDEDMDRLIQTVGSFIS